MRAKPTRQQICTAHHEAGHAVVAWVYQFGIRRVTIIPTDDDDSLGHMLNFAMKIRPDLNNDGRTRRRVESRVAVLLAGGIAEAIFAGRKNHVGSHDDYRKAVSMADYICGTTEQTEAYLNWIGVRTRDILKQQWNWKAVKAVARALLKRNTLTGKEVQAVINKAMMPSPLARC